jgi:hypothetical protein
MAGPLLSPFGDPAAPTQAPPTSPFGDPVAPAAAPSPQDERAARLRKIAAAGLNADPGAKEVFNDSITLGLQKPAAGLAAGLGGKLLQLLGNSNGSDFGEGYTAGTGAYQDMMDKANKNSGWGGTAAGLAGGLVAGGPARGVVEQGLWPMIKSAAGFGAVEGAARNSEDPLSAAEGAAKGGLASAATAGTIGTALSLPGFGARRAAAREANRGTPPDELTAQAKGIYKRLDDGGVAYDSNQSSQLASSLNTDLRQNGFDPQGAHKVLSDGVLSRIEDQSGHPMSLETLQQIRSQASSNTTNPDPNVRRIAGRIVNHIEGFVTNETPAMSQLPPDQVGPLWQQARQLWRASNTAADIGWRVGKAENRAASTNSGGNEENAIRQNIRGALDKAEQPGRYNPYNAPELAQMQKVVDGTQMQNWLRSAGNQVSGIPVKTLMGGLAAGAGLHGGFDPISTLLAGSAGLGASALTQKAGSAIKNQSTRIAQDQADSLIRLISTGSLAKTPSVMSGPPTRAALAALMARKAAARGGGIFAGQEASQQ